MKYSKLKEEQQKRVDEFEGIFFAFNEEQFEKGMKNLGLKPDQTNKVYSIGAGGFLLKSKAKDWKNMFKQLDTELKRYLSHKENLLNALVYELRNYEYSYTRDIQPALDALSLDIKDINLEILNKAKKIAMNTVW